MNATGDISMLAAVLTVAFLVVGAAITLIGSLGLLRIDSFYGRAHASTLGTTLGTAGVAIASMIYFSALEARPALHGLLVIVFITVTAPVSLMVLVRAAAFRNEFENQDSLPDPTDTEPG
jgi:multicomponent K+:H+ antiporter subunit G